MAKHRIARLFEQHSDEFLKFENVENKLNKRPDLHAFILLDMICPGDSDMVSAAAHDEIYLDVSADDLAENATESQIIDLHRCGVRYDEDIDGLCMFV